MSDYQCSYCNDKGGLCCDYFFSTDVIKKLASHLHTNRLFSSLDPYAYEVKAKELLATASDEGVIVLPNGSFYRLTAKQLKETKNLFV